MYNPSVRIVLKRNRLREWQKVNHLSDRQLAKLLRISHSTVSRVLAGNRQPGSKFICAVLDRMDCTFDEYFGVAQ